MFDLLVSSDLLVDDVEGVATTLVKSFGLPEPRPSWIHHTPGLNCTYWLRAQLDRAIAPTAIEVIGPSPDGGWFEGLRTVRDLQGARPMKTHATVVSVPDVEPYLERLRAASIPYRADEPGGHNIPFLRLFPGQGEHDGITTYDPAYDAGLFVEFIPTGPLMFPENVEAPPPSEVGEGAVVRIATRSFLADDIDEAARCIDRSFGWEPSRPIWTSSIDGARVAQYKGRFPGSAAIELLQPVLDDSLCADHLRLFGRGAYRITLAVNGLEAAADQLKERGLMYSFEEGRGLDQARVRVDPTSLGGSIFDLVDV